MSVNTKVHLQEGIDNLHAGLLEIPDIAHHSVNASRHPKISWQSQVTC